MRFAVLASSLVLATATLALGAAHAQAQAPLDTAVRAHVTMLVGADGVPSDIKVTGASPDIGALVYKRVKEWKFRPAQWKGTPVAAPFVASARLDVQSTPSGGYAIRMSNLEAAGGGDESLVPAREDDIGVRSFLTQIVFGYVVNLRADGSVESIEPVLPARTPPTQAQSIARKIEGMLKSWRGTPSNVDGQRIACSRLYLEQHMPDVMGRGHVPKGYRGWAEGADPGAFPADVAAAMQAQLDALDEKGTRCPAPVLETKVAGVAL